MSHFIFGTFDSSVFSEQKALLVKEKLEQSNIKVLFNQELSFCNDLERMLENNGGSEYYTFCFTSTGQEFNSDDVIFPYDLYDEDELFPNGDDRSHFNNICGEHINRLKFVVEQLITMLNTKNIRVFTVDGFDDSFTKLNISIDGMIDDILEQVKITFSLNSKIYELQLPEQH